MDRYTKKIALINARFFAYHGYYPAEQRIGHEFFVDICCFVEIDVAPTDEQLEYTINYEDLYHIAKNEMLAPKKLLETVVAKMLHAVRTKCEEAHKVEVTIRKSHPPFGGDLSTAMVSLSWQRDETTRSEK